MKKAAVGRAELYHGDCLEILPRLPPQSCIVTDPPYGVRWADWGGSKSRKAHKRIANDDRPFTDFLPLVSPESMHVFTTFSVLRPWTDALAGYRLDLLVWDKIVHGIGDTASYAPTHELILYATKARVPLAHGRPQDVLRVRRPNADLHPTEKPVDLMRKIIRHQPYDTILDPFMGVGSTGVAAMLEGRKFIGIELEGGYYDVACKRIKEAASQPSLFAANDNFPKGTQGDWLE